CTPDCQSCDVHASSELPAGCSRSVLSPEAGREMMVVSAIRLPGRAVAIDRLGRHGGGVNAAFAAVFEARDRQLDERRGEVAVGYRDQHAWRMGGDEHDTGRHED